MKHTKVDKYVDIKQRYGIWKFMPVASRADNLKTARQFAAEHGVAPKTLVKWNDDPIILEARNNLLMVLGGHQMEHVLKKVTEDALSGKAQAQRLYFELMGMLSKDKAQSQAHAQTFNITVEKDARVIDAES